MTTFWFTSDTHFSHSKIIEYSKRPFANAEEMNETLIANWNTLVKSGDIVYHLGDFGLTRSPQDVLDLTRRLKGQKFLIYGNHDRFIRQKRQDNYGFVQITIYKEIKIDDKKIILMHYPMESWNGSFRGSYQLHGHCHGNLPRDYNLFRLDVGVDCWNYQPISYDIIAKEMKKHQFIPRERRDL